MNNNLKVIPGVLEKEWSEIEKMLESAKTFTDTVHVDIIDGQFVGNTTFLDPEPFKKYSSDLFLELHMMVVNPITLIEPYAKAGFKRFLGHVEHMPNQQDFLNIAKQYGEAGLALDGPTNLEAIDVPFESLDSILIYTSDRVGFSGPKLLPERFEKIKELKQKTNIPVEVDGGINDTTIFLAKEAGATHFVSTSFIWNENPMENFNKLNQILGENNS